MKIAIPVHQGRIAPVFDTCRRILVFSRGVEDEVPTVPEDWCAETPRRRPVRLKEMGIEALLCGAISSGMEDQIHRLGIMVVAWLAGEPETVLRAFREGVVLNPEHAMPGVVICRKRLCMKRARLPGDFSD
jgi:predicted Fe-Mo cluster-binding NifX family protein